MSSSNRFFSAHDIMTSSQVKAAADRVPLTMDALETFHFMDDDDEYDSRFGSQCRKEYGEHMLELMKDYHYAKNWQEYHHCGIFVILHHCALQIDVHS